MLDQIDKIKNLPLNLSAVICTIGPACSNEETLLSMVESGMRIARLNFSHGDHEAHSKTIKLLEKVRAKSGREFAIALDTKGPEIRTGDVSSSNGSVELKADSLITFTNDIAKYSSCTHELIYIDYPSLNSLNVGQHIFIEDGLMRFEVTKKVNKNTLECKTLNGGQLGNKKGVNLPGVKVELPSMTDKDKADLEFGAKQNVDMIFASFIRSKEHVLEMKAWLKEKGDNKGEIMIIPKIENEEGLENFDEILEVSDGIMAARGDLGIETQLETVPLKQRIMSLKCVQAGKPFIVATQMLESMITNPRATRAEVNDIVSAILCGASCVMLSGETAKGKYPVAAVKTQAKVACYVEHHIDMLDSYGLVVYSRNSSHRSFRHPATYLAINSKSKFVLALESGNLKNGDIPSILNSLPDVPVIYFGCEARKVRQCNLFKGILPTLIDKKHIDHKDMPDTIKTLTQIGVKSFNNYVGSDESFHAKKGDIITVLAICPGNYNLTLITIE
ncbi:MAG: hypothetical protein MHMPM18_000053 [Marteilia pararefringens]